MSRPGVVDFETWTRAIDRRVTLLERRPQSTGAGSGGVTDHGQLTGLDDPDHPISAVKGLQTALDGKVPLSGGTMTGPLVLTRPGSDVLLDLRPEAGKQALVTFREGSVTRWTFYRNASGNFRVARYDTSGAFQDAVLDFNPATGLGTVTGPPVQPLGIATKRYVDNAVAKQIGQAARTTDASLANGVFTDIASGWSVEPVTGLPDGWVNLDADSSGLIVQPGVWLLQAFATLNDPTGSVPYLVTLEPLVGGSTVLHLNGAKTFIPGDYGAQVEVSGSWTVPVDSATKRLAFRIRVTGATSTMTDATIRATQM